MNEITQDAVIIPGAERSGTSSVHALLTRQEKFSETRVKEPDFFLTRTEEIKNNINEYLRNFKDESKVLLDSSVSYGLNKAVPGRIKYFFKNEPRIIILLRDPVKRAYTSYYHNHYEAEVDLRSFEQIIKKLKHEDGSIEERERSIKQEAINKEEIKLSKAFKRNINWLKKQEHKPFYNITRGYDYSNKFLYFTTSAYTSWVKRYQKIFDNVKIVFFEELINKPSVVLEDLFTFLNIEYNKNVSLPHENKTLTPNKITTLFKKLNPPVWLVKVLKKAVPNCLIYEPKKRISRELYKEARDLMKNEYDYWFEQYPRLRKYWTYK